MNHLDIIKKKFEDFGSTVETLERTSKSLGTDGKVFETVHKTLKILVPEEKGAKPILIFENQNLRDIETTEIEKFRFLKGYEGIWSKDLSVIECQLDFENGSYFFHGEFGRISEMLEIPISELLRKNDAKTYIEFPSPKTGIRILLGICSAQYALLESLQRKSYIHINSEILTIRIEGVSVNTHEEAKALLIKLSTTVFFQFDLATHIPVRLSLGKSEIFNSFRNRKTIFDDIKFSNPKFEYDEEPFSLYMYARSSEMPLLKYLAFYQVLEFYFPVYSLNDARLKIKNFIKNPLFDVNKESDVANIVNLIKTSGKGRSIGDERSQIKATMQAIIDQQSLMDFFNEDPDRKDSFDQQKKSKGIARQKINFNSTDNDIRIDTALRIYEIRCRVVHAKDDENFELLLPYSPELRNMNFDLQLIEFLAQKALIAGSRPLVI